MITQASAAHDYDQVESRRAARKLMRYSPRIDVLSNGEDDYQIMLLTEAWEARKKFANKKVAGSERLYCCKAIWNACATLGRMRRSRAFANPVVSCATPVENLEIESSFDLEAAQHARETLELLSSSLEAGDWDALRRVGLSDGEQIDAYEPEVDGTANAFYKRIERARRKARDLLREKGE